MSNLSIHELDEIQDFVDSAENYLSAIGLKLGVDDNLWNWKELLLVCPESVGVSKTLDPAVNDLRPGNSFWIYLESDDGEIVATQADRLILTEDFVNEYLVTHRLFGDRLPLLKYYRLALNENLPNLTGRLNLGGGIWIHPMWRGHDLGGLMSRLGRALALRHFLVDYYVTIMKKGRFFGKACGFDLCEPLIQGFYPGRNEMSAMDLLWASKPDTMMHLAETRYSSHGSKFQPLENIA